MDHTDLSYVKGMQNKAEAGDHSSWPQCITSVEEKRRRPSYMKHGLNSMSYTELIISRRNIGTL